MNLDIFESSQENLMIQKFRLIAWQNGVLLVPTKRAWNAFNLLTYKAPPYYGDIYFPPSKKQFSEKLHTYVCFLQQYLHFLPFEKFIFFKKKP